MGWGRWGEDHWLWEVQEIRGRCERWMGDLRRCHIFKTMIFHFLGIFFVCLKIGTCFLCVFIFWNLGSNSWHFQRDVMTIEWIFWYPMVPQKPEGQCWHRSKVQMLLWWTKNSVGGKDYTTTTHPMSMLQVDASGTVFLNIKSMQVQEFWTDVNSWWFHYIPRIGFIKSHNFNSHSVISLYYQTFSFNTIPTNRVKSRTSLFTRATKHHCRPSLAAAGKSCQAKLA